MNLRLCLSVCLVLLANIATAQVCTPNLMPEQAFLLITNRSTTNQTANSLANPTKLININKASEAELTQLDGIGAKKAQQIILYREMIAPFAKADDLANVKGIGKATVEKNRHKISIQ